MVPPATEFPVLAQEGLVYLDSAATSQTPRSVIEAMDRYYNEYRASIHRGVYPLAAEATEAYEGAREKVAAFTGSTIGETVFTRNGDRGDQPRRLHVGRRRRARRHGRAHADGAPLEHRAVAAAAAAGSSGSPIDDDGLLDLDALDAALARGPKVVAVAHVSNVLGTVNPIAEIARRAHDAGALVIVDGMQAVPHMPVDVAELDVDFYAWTGHKAYGPTGIGVLHGRRELLEAMPPFLGGGHMIARVTEEVTTFAELPAKFEAGTMTIAEAIGLGAATDFLSGIGMDAVCAHARDIAGYALERLREVPGLRLFGPDIEHRGGARRVRARRRAPARRGRDPRPRGRLRARRPPLRAAADAPPRRVGDDPRVVRRALHARRGRPADRRARYRAGRVRLMDDLYRENILQHYKKPA